MGKLLVPGKGSGVKILHCNHGKIVGSRKGFWSENLALQSWEFFWFQERALEWKLCTAIMGKILVPGKRFWSKNFALQSWEKMWFQERVLEWKFCTASMGKLLVPGKGSGVKILHCNHGNFLVPGKGSGVKILHCNHGIFFGFQERVLEWKFCTAIMGKLLVPGKGSGVKILHCNHGKIFGSRKRFWSIHVRKTWPDFEEIHQNLQKTWCTFDALLKVHQNDALLMHFHMIMMHFWCTFKRVSKVHQKCIMIFHPNHIKISKNWGVLPRVSCQPVTAGVPKIDIAQGDKKWQNKITCKSRTLHI